MATDLAASSPESRTDRVGRALVRRTTGGLAWLLPDGMTLFAVLLAISGPLEPMLRANGQRVAADALRGFLHLNCHQLVQRCLYVGALPMALCARCEAIYVSWVLGAIAITVARRPLMRVFGWRVLMLVGCALMVPMLLDAAPQLFGLWESTNARRVSTGALAGVGVVLVLYPSAWKARDEMRDALRDE